MKRADAVKILLLSLDVAAAALLFAALVFGYAAWHDVCLAR
jgi:hypothetical protein